MRDGFEQKVLVAALIVLAIATLALIAWQILDVLLLVFGAVLVATILHAIGDPIARRTSLSRAATLPIAGVILIGVVTAAIWIFQAEAGAQLAAALDAAQNALPTVGERLGIPDLSSYATELAHRALSSGGILGNVTIVGTSALQAAINLFIILFGGVYLAVDPRLYRDGLVKLFPAGSRDQIRDTLDAAGRALKLWLFGQLFSMVITGVLTGFALWTIGLPSAIGLGLIAGLTEFIPLLGPFMGAAPALLIAMPHGLTTMLWTVLAFAVIQQIESNLLQPLIARRSVSLPPATLLFAVVLFGALFGTLGILFAAPLAVVSFVAIKKLYVRDTLGEDTPLPGERSS